MLTERIKDLYERNELKKKGGEIHQTTSNRNEINPTNLQGVIVKTKRTILIAVLTAILFAAGLYAAETEPPKYAPGELIVKLEHGILNPPTSDETPIANVPIQGEPSNQAQLTLAFQTYGVRSVERVFKSIFAQPNPTFVTKRGDEVQLEDLSQVYILRMNEGLDMEQVAAQVTQLPGVIYADPNYFMFLNEPTPNDPSLPSQWGLDNDPDEETGIKWDINALRAWNIETGDPDVRLAILDTGLEPNHKDEEGDEFYGRIVGERYMWP